MKRTCMRLCIGLALAPPVAAATPGPADPSAPVPAVTYQSTFESYRGYREEPLADWRGLNEDVARAGGHVGVMRGSGATAPRRGEGVPPAAGQPPARGSGQAPAGGAHQH